MPQPRTLKIAEIFPSIQGEGLRQGEPTIFIRLSGCNLKCDFCDTRYAWKEGTEYTAPQILEEVKTIFQSFPAEWVCLTGGEPLIQDISGLVKLLKKEGFRIQVETNATHYYPLPIDWFSVSPKPDLYDFRPEYREKAREVKIVVTKNLNLDRVRHLRNEFPERIPILLQPQSNRKWSRELGAELTREALKIGLKNIRISCQLHRVYGFK